MGKTFKERQDGAGGRPRQTHRDRNNKRNTEQFEDPMFYGEYRKKDADASRRRK